MLTTGFKLYFGMALGALVAAITFVRANLADSTAMTAVFAGSQPQGVINLAAQAGVRYSLTNPHAYAEANLVGFLNVLEGCRAADVDHLVYASSSSVYGGNTKTPFSERDPVDHPVSLYAATKQAFNLGVRASGCSA